MFLYKLWSKVIELGHQLNNHENS